MRPSERRARCLEARQVAKRFGGRWALRPLSVSVAASEILGVIGPNGAGKTTLLKILAGVHRPTAGTVELSVSGGCPGGAGGSPPSPPVGWVPQQLGVYRRLTVAENLRFFARVENVNDVERAVAAALQATGLASRAGDLVGELSGGNQQRVNVAAGLLASPPVLVLDEPTASLDLPQRDRVWRLLEGRAGTGSAVVYSTHNVIEAYRHSDRLMVLAAGECVFLGEPPDLLDILGIGGPTAAAIPPSGAGVDRARARDAPPHLEPAYTRFLLGHEE